MNYPDDWPLCGECGYPVLDSHLTCGRAECNEALQRDRRAGMVGMGEEQGE